MKKTILSLMFLIFVSSSVHACGQCSVWIDSWQKGMDLMLQGNYQEASSFFDISENLMSEEIREKNAFFLVNRAENNFMIGDYQAVLDDTEKALNSKNLNDSERLVCGIRRMVVFMKIGKEEEAFGEYSKHITDSPLMPKWQLTNNKIIIRNVPDSECYKKMTKNFMLENFCEEGNDIHEYGNIWTIDITKKNINAGYADDIRETRGPEQERACCNTCSTFAVSANIICACMSTNPHPFYVGCKIACVMFVEQIKQACEWCCYHGGYEEKCWKNFQTWKLDYSKEQPDCPKPPAQKCR